MTEQSYQHLFRVSMAAANGGYGVLSTSEKLGAALALNRHDWLADMSYTIAEAVDRIGPDWAAVLPRVARDVQDQLDAQGRARKTAEEDLKVTMAFAVDGAPDSSAVDYGAEFNAKLATISQAPGYRDISLILDLTRVGSNDSIRATINLPSQDGEWVMLAVRGAHELAWRHGQPIDVRDGEERPRWL